MEAEPAALTGAEASGGTYSIRHILDSPPEWVLGLNMGQFKAYRAVWFP